MAAEAADVAKILIATRPDGVGFYKYMLGFELIGEPALYPPGDVKIALLGGTMSKARRPPAFAEQILPHLRTMKSPSMRRALSPILNREEAA